MIEDKGNSRAGILFPAADLSVKNLCKTLHVSKNILYKKFNDFYGGTVNEYITKRRLQKAEQMLRNTGQNIAAISETLGFYNYTYFSKLFKARTGLSPSEYHKHAQEWQEKIKSAPNAEKRLLS